jgi:hypothetical protein
MASRLDTAGNLEGERFPNLETVVAREMLRTPTVGMVNQDRSQDPQYMSKLLAKGQTVTLAAQMKSAEMLPTPVAKDWKGRSQRGDLLPDSFVPTGGGIYLNPSFVEEMMGFPVGWTVCEH